MVKERSKKCQGWVPREGFRKGPLKTQTINIQTAKREQTKGASRVETISIEGSRPQMNDYEVEKNSRYREAGQAVRKRTMGVDKQK